MSVAMILHILFEFIYIGKGVVKPRLFILPNCAAEMFAIILPVCIQQ